MSTTLAAVTIDGTPFKVPSSTQLYQPVTRIEFTQLSTGEVDGAGLFDKLMASVRAHLQLEFEKSRITGADYAKTYIELTQAAMSTAMQFVFNRESSFWAAQQGQIAAIDGLVKLETSRAGYASARYNYETTLPAQTLLLEAQTDQAEKQVELLGKQVETATYNLSTTLPAQTLLLGVQKDLADAQKVVADRQAILVEEQTEAARAQTLDVRRDTLTVTGLIGRQKELYAKQVVAYERDAQTKAAKLFTDAWTVQKTIDEGLTAPTGFTNASLDDVLSAIKTANNLD